MMEDWRESAVLTARYGPRAQDMWRWVDEPADEAVGASVAQCLSLDRSERGKDTAFALRGDPRHRPHVRAAERIRLSST